MIRVAMPPGSATGEGREPSPTIWTLAAGRSVYRLFRPSSFAPSAVTWRFNGPRARFDHQRGKLLEQTALAQEDESPVFAPTDDEERGILYAAFTLSCCVVEVFDALDYVDPRGWQFSRLDSNARFDSARFAWQSRDAIGHRRRAFQRFAPDGSGVVSLFLRKVRHNRRLTLQRRSQRRTRHRALRARTRRARTHARSAARQQNNATASVACSANSQFGARFGLSAREVIELIWLPIAATSYDSAHHPIRVRARRFHPAVFRP